MTPCTPTVTGLTLLFVAVLLLISIAYASNTTGSEIMIMRKDGFAAQVPTTTTVYSSMPLNMSNWIASSYALKGGLYTDAQYDAFIEVATSTNQTKRKTLLDLNGVSSVQYVADPLEMETTFASYTKLGESPPGYFVALQSPNKMNALKCSFDLHGKTVGYFHRTDRDFITAILNGYRISTSGVTLTRVKSDSSFLDRSTTDVIITFLIPNSPFHLWLLKQRVAFTGFRELDINRVRLFYPNVTIQKVNLNRLLLGKYDSSSMGTNTVTSIVDLDDNDTLLPTMKLSMIAIISRDADIIAQSKGNVMVYGSDVTEEFATRLDLDRESLDPAFKCYGDANIKSKALCESPYDAWGEPKSSRTAWDKPCAQDADCPFYKANKRYRNSRGGCGTSAPGVCELPIGLRRVAFRLYDDTGPFAPFCYGCDPYDTACCKKQGDNPDYAFENDTDARRAVGLKTSIPMR